MPTTHPAVLGVVLAGGRSSRMGREKASLPHPGGGTFLSHAIEQLAGCCLHVGCSLAADFEATSHPDLILPTRIHRLIDIRDDRGPAEGVSLATELALTLRCTGVLVTPVDLPGLLTEHLTELLREFLRNEDRIVCAFSDEPDSPKPLQPLVAIYPVVLRAELDRLAAAESRSLYRFIEKHDFARVTLPAHVLHNVNSPQDYRP